MRRRSWPARLARAAVTALLSTAMLSVILVFAFRWLPVPVTAFMVHDEEPDARHDWVPWGEISGHVAVAVIAAEDQKFPAHDGFDFDAIDKALDDAGRGRRQRGASTISQQVAKNLFLWPDHSWLRKGLEVWFTIWIETLWPKRRILEVYLNSAEFGRSVWGVEAASRMYFGKPAALLNQPEAALLAAVLPSPKRMRVANPSAYVRRRQDWILNQMRRLGGTRLLETLD
jgi:monofunctional biosynthetic peptidoglycan transglycosylase